MIRSKLFAAAAALAMLWTAAPTMAQVGFNIDYGAQPAGSPIPPSTFGAAGLQPGTWNSPTLGAVPFSLVDISGAATAVTITNAPAGAFFFSNTQGIGTGDNAALLNDIIDGATTVTISGLAAGQYSVFTYAIAPDDGTFITNVVVNGGAPTPVGGVWAGTFVAGNSYALNLVTLGAGDPLTITTSVASGFASLNGLQIVPVAVPEPTSLALISIPAIGGLIMKRRRAKSTAK